MEHITIQETRKLATVRRVAELLPIPNADAIECAVVDGWKVVVKKGEFRPGDEGVYFEIDSLLPVRDERFSFLAKGAVGQEYARLRTIKLRGQISQGLLLPASTFPELDRGEELTGETVSEIIAAADGPNMNGAGKREGLIFKSTVNHLSFKAISNAYLLKYEE